MRQATNACPPPNLGMFCLKQQVRNQEVNYKAIAFYLEQHPLKLVRLLTVLTPNLDHSRVVHQLRRAENLPLAIDYLKSVQKVRRAVDRVQSVVPR